MATFCQFSPKRRRGGIGNLLDIPNNQFPFQKCRSPRWEKWCFFAIGIIREGVLSIQSGFLHGLEILGGCGIWISHMWCKIRRLILWIQSHLSNKWCFFIIHYLRWTASKVVRTSSLNHWHSDVNQSATSIPPLTHLVDWQQATLTA